MRVSCSQLLHTVLHRFDREENRDHIRQDLITKIRNLIRNGINTVTLSEITEIATQLKQHYQTLQQQPHGEGFRLPMPQIPTPTDARVYHHYNSELAPAAHVSKTKDGDEEIIGRDVTYQPLPEVEGEEKKSLT